MINEAEIDESHEWSSIRHPSVPRAPAPPQRPPTRPQRGRLVNPRGRRQDRLPLAAICVLLIKIIL